MSAKLTLGYSSRTEAVVALRAQGLSTGIIAARIGIEPKTVTALEASARRKGTSPGDRRPAAAQPSLLDGDTRLALRPHAAKREMTVDRLARLILQTIVDDDMVDAVLDDGFRSELR